MSNRNQRSEIPSSTLTSTLKELELNLRFNIECKGSEAFASNHEIYGVIAEELNEYLDAIQQKATQEEKVKELYDIAIAAILGIASIENRNVNW